MIIRLLKVSYSDNRAPVYFIEEKKYCCDEFRVFDREKCVCDLMDLRLTLIDSEKTVVNFCINCGEEVSFVIEKYVHRRVISDEEGNECYKDEVIK